VTEEELGALYAKRDRWLLESGGSIWHRRTWESKHQISINWYASSPPAPHQLFVVRATYAGALQAILEPAEVWQGLARTPAEAPSKP
jgi:hypothetical protein